MVGVDTSVGETSAVFNLLFFYLLVNPFDFSFIFSNVDVVNTSVIVNNFFWLYQTPHLRYLTEFWMRLWQWLLIHHLPHLMLLLIYVLQIQSEAYSEPYQTSRWSVLRIRKTIHLRYLTGFWIRFCQWLLIHLVLIHIIVSHHLPLDLCIVV